jgi:pimeloyl-ACP methyl ester carboxylesterase
MVRKVFFRNSVGDKIVGILHGKRNAHAIVLVHGLTGDKDEHGLFVNAAERFSDMGFLVLRFDLSGSGESSGPFNQDDAERWKDDLNAAISFLRKIGVRKIALVGLSLGAYISTLCSSKTVRCVALWSPGYIDEVKGLKCPVIVIAGENDPGRDDSKRTFDHARNPKRFEAIPSSGHLFIEPLHQTQLINITFEWIKAWLI